MKLDESTKKILAENAHMAKALSLQVRESDSLAQSKQVCVCVCMLDICVFIFVFLFSRVDVLYAGVSPYCNLRRHLNFLIFLFVLFMCALEL